MWDEQIDDVARRLTEAPPPRHLRARVLCRLGEGTRSHLRPAVWKLAASGVAVAIIVLIALRPWWHSRVGPMRAGPLTVAVQPGAAESTAARASTVAEGAAPHAKPTETGGAAPRSTARTTRLPPPGGQVPDFIEQLAVAPLAVDGLWMDGIAPPAAIESTALDLSPLSMTPLASEERPHD